VTRRAGLMVKPNDVDMGWGWVGLMSPVHTTDKRLIHIRFGYALGRERSIVDLAEVLYSGL